MARIGKPPLVCPAIGVEQFVNGDFELGGFTGWTATGDWYVRDDGYPRFYVAWMYGDGVPISGVLEQEFLTPIPVACFKDTSIFKVVTYWGYACWYDITDWKIEIIYTDDTVTTLDISGDSNKTWTEHNLKTILATGKTVKTIRITGSMDGHASYMGIDSCTCQI